MYDLKQAGHNWYKHLHEEIIKLGFAQSKVDKGLYFRKDCKLILYVNDCLLFSPKTIVLGNILQFRITMEDDVDPYLGIKVSCTTIGIITVRQLGLIENVISIFGLETEYNKTLKTYGHYMTDL